MESQRLLLSVEEAADSLGISRAAMYQILGRGEVASVKLGRSRRIPVDALRRFVSERTTEPVAAA